MKTYKRKGEWKRFDASTGKDLGWGRIHLYDSTFGIIVCMDGPANRGIGGASGLHYTSNPENVTCKNCLRKRNGPK